MSKDSIFIYCLFFMYMRYEDEGKKTRKLTSNAGLMSVSHNHSSVWDIFENK